VRERGRHPSLRPSFPSPPSRSYFLLPLTPSLLPARNAAGKRAASAGICLPWGIRPRSSPCPCSERWLSRAVLVGGCADFCTSPSRRCCGRLREKIWAARSLGKFSTVGDALATRPTSWLPSASWRGNGPRESGRDPRRAERWQSPSMVNLRSGFLAPTVRAGVVKIRASRSRVATLPRAAHALAAAHGRVHLPAVPKPHSKGSGSGRRGCGVTSRTSSINQQAGGNAGLH
jgi:hypothetical protein